MGIISSDEEPSWSDVYNLQTRNTILELRIDKLRTCLQGIKAIAEGIRSYLEVPAPRDVRFEMDRILDLITKAESEGNDV